MFYPCSAFDGFFMRTLNSAPETYKTADFLNVDNNHCNHHDLEKTTKLFTEFKKNLTRIPYYKFENDPIPLSKVAKTKFLVSFYDPLINTIRQEIADIALKRIQENKDDFDNANEFDIYTDWHLKDKIEEITNDKRFFAVYRGSKKAIFKGKKGHSVIYVMFVFAEAFEFYQNMFVQKNITPKIFAEKLGFGVFGGIPHGEIGSKWIISDRLHKNDKLSGYEHLGSLHAGRRLELQVFKKHQSLKKHHE
jgi:hypothetical protein